jgi:predicted nuclease of restriction endonuclease-like RecB superfamily
MALNLSESEYKALITPKPEKAPGVSEDPRNKGLRALQALGRMKSGEMNKTEREWAVVLDRLQTAGEVLWWKWNCIKLRLADNTFYVPDFMVLHKDLILTVYDVKGFWTDDAKVKIKVAASMYPFIFRAVSKVPKKNGGGWKAEEF